MKKVVIKSILSLSIIAFLIGCNTEETTIENKALAKIEQLEGLMEKAKNKSIDVTREETTLWFAKEFVKFANWDETNKEAISKLFGYERYYKPNKDSLADMLPDFERKKVIEIVDFIGTKITVFFLFTYCI